MPRGAAGRLPRPVAGPIFSVPYGVPTAVVRVVGFECSLRLAVLKIMRGAFAVPSMVVRTKGAIA
jgi:hypothetical protein